MIDAKSVVRVLLAALLFGMAAAPARADWSQPSVEYQCDRQAGTFTLRGMVEGNDETFIPHRPGFHPLPPRNRVTCKLQGTVVALEVTYVAPRDRGDCGAVAFYAVKKLAVGKVELFRNVPFNHICGIDPSLVDIVIAKRGRAVHVKSCTGTWEWEPHYRDTECTEKILD